MEFTYENVKLLMELSNKVNVLEEECKQLHTRVFSLENQLEHQIPRINDIEDKIDWSNPGKI